MGFQWKITQGTDKMNYNYLDLKDFHKYTKGQGVKIAVLDSEIDLSHREFKNKKIKCMSFVEDGPENSHGTAVSSLIIGKNIGIAPESELYHMKILSGSHGGAVSWERALESAVSLGVDIVCMSVGTKMKLSPSMRQALQRAEDNGVIVLAPSGNEGRDLLRNPANDDRVIAVGGFNREGLHSKNSNRSIKIEANALSQGVLVANTGSNMKYIKRSGTSFANAIVAGQLALMISYTRDKDYEINIREFLKEYNKRNPLVRKQINMNDIKKELDIYIDELSIKNNN